MPLVLVTLCTYNERENLGALVPEIRRTLPDADVIVIDDGSPDGTGALADELSASDPRVRVLHRAGKLGLGSAILAGMRRAIADGYDFVINMDADFSHDPRHLPALVACMERADVAIGSRYVPGGGIEGWGPLRHFMSRGINWYARLLLGLSTRDNSGAYRCYRCSKLAQINLDRVRARGYAFQEEILFHCRRAGCQFEETPIVFHDRRYGTSKINWRESAAALWIILRLGAGNACGLFSKSGNSQREANSDVVE
ncbi:MAG TPA: polyprenol monophosphomannose synthase [Planctomycetaceae bacterium]|jgi:dolichol-phosphate mannosyltransferase|nr:polyprenol monophosphomannose synthase [Planctomycetaceae bacterium]